MDRVDKKQTIASKTFKNTDTVVQYFRSEELNGHKVSCIIRLSNGFEAIGEVFNTYSSKTTQAELDHIAHQRALNYAESHGYDLA